jgi:hypothetical protein
VFGPTRYAAECVCANLVLDEEALRGERVEHGPEVNIIKWEAIQLKTAGLPCKAAFPIGCSPETGECNTKGQLVLHLCVVQVSVPEEARLDSPDACHY